jgi:inorganic phosphate transporter, PiT family
MALVAVIVIGLLVAYANGSNDIFKGVATLFGSGTATYKRALLWAMATTALGAAFAIPLAGELLTTFTGKGLVPSGVATDPRFAVSVAAGAALTVLAASRMGLPVSTTHALMGALVGAGTVLSPNGVHASALAGGFVLPLLLSPLLAVGIALLLYPVLRSLRRRFNVSHETCVCVGTRVVGVVPGPPTDHTLRAMMLEMPGVSMATGATCRVRYRGTVAGVGARPLLDGAHLLSAGAVSFARGLNDAPKIAALLCVGHALDPAGAVAATGTAMVLGGWFGARRVAETMSHGVTDMNPGQGFTANLVTSGLVVGASTAGLPVSTTHVSCGSLFGIAAVTGGARWRTIGHIALAWVTTLPLAAALAFAVAWLAMVSSG